MARAALRKPQDASDIAMTWRPEASGIRVAAMSLDAAKLVPYTAAVIATFSTELAQAAGCG